MPSRQPEHDLTDRKTLLIIGAATARAGVGAGWTVGLMARSEDKLEKLCG